MDWFQQATNKKPHHIDEATFSSQESIY